MMRSVTGGIKRGRFALSEKRLKLKVFLWKYQNAVVKIFSYHQEFKLIANT